MTDILSLNSVYQITADAACYFKEAHVPGAWSGSAFRNHPCGIIRGTIKFTNAWHTSKSCSICITDGTGWSRTYCTNSSAHGDPHPRPIDGESLCVWSDGHWKSEEFRVVLEAKVIAILRDAREYIFRFQNWKAVEEECSRLQHRRETEERTRRALQAAAVA